MLRTLWSFRRRAAFGSLVLLAGAQPLWAGPPRPAFGAPRPVATPPTIVQTSLSEEAQPEALPTPGLTKGADLAKAPSSVPAPVNVYPIDLCTALKVAEAENPTIGISRQAIQEALARRQQADVLLLPSLRAGTNYHDHEGALQTSFGELRYVDSSALYFGGGARTVAAETVAFPMIQIISPLADALLEPLIARRLVAVRNAESAATANSTLLEVSSRFLDLVNAEAQLAAYRKSEEDMNEIVQLTLAFAQAGLGRDADASRARGDSLLLHSERQRAEEVLAVASSNLAEVLNLDPSIQLQTPAQATGLLNLVDLHMDPEALIRQAQAWRPELAANNAEISRRQVMLRQEQLRPWLPTISFGFSAGSFGGGTNRSDLVPVNPSFGNFGGRTDLDVLAYWTVQNMGAGNIARQNERRAQRDVAQVEQVRLMNEVRREVIAAYSRAETGRRRVDIAHLRLQTAEAGYQADVRRIRGGQGLPIEVLNSTNRLIEARRALIETYLEYNRSQFQLFVALGRTPAGICPTP